MNLSVGVALVCAVVGCGSIQLVEAGLLASSLPRVLSTAPKADKRLVRRRQLSAWGISAKDHEGVDVEKDRQYEVNYREVSEERFEEENARLGNVLGLTCMANNRGYANQDNFLVELTSVDRFTGGAGYGGLPLELGLLVVLDGHSKYGHIVSSYAVDRIRKMWKLFVPRFLAKFPQPSKARDAVLKNALNKIYIRVQKSLHKDILRPEHERGPEIPNMYRDLFRQISGEDMFDPAIMEEVADSGATMSVTIVDFLGSKVYVGSAGDSPVLGRAPDGVRALVSEQSAADLAERSAIIKRLNDDRYTFNRSRYNERRDETVLVFERMNTLVARDIAEISLGAATNEFGGIALDWRVGPFQPARSVGHLNYTPGVDYLPQVEVYDIDELPLDYLLMSSDGLMHVLLDDGMNHVMRDRMNDIKERDSDGKLQKFRRSEGYNENGKLLKEAYDKFLSMEGQSKKEFFDALRSVSEIYDTLMAEAEIYALAEIEAAMDGLVNYGRSEVSDAQWQWAVRKMFPKIMQRLARYERNDDDLTGVFFRFKKWRPRENKPQEITEFLEDAEYSIGREQMPPAMPALPAITSPREAIEKFPNRRTMNLQPQNQQKSLFRGRTMNLDDDDDEDEGA